MYVEYQVRYRYKSRQHPSEHYTAEFSSLAAAKSFLEHIKTSKDFDSAVIYVREVSSWRKEK